MSTLAISVSERLKILRAASACHWDDAIDASTDIKESQRDAARRDEAMIAWDEAIDAAVSDRFEDANVAIHRAWKLAYNTLVSVSAESSAHLAITHAEEMVRDSRGR